LSDATRVELAILGQTLTIRTEESADYIRSLAQYLEERVATIKKGGVRDAGAALILAALDIADELFRARDDVSRREGDVSARLGALVTLLEQVTPKSFPPSS
jgi:cell division protein ZapA (FtsZ GTPase activity inhibitor)